MIKVGVVGCGLVGSTAAYAMVMDGVGREIVLVDLDRERAQAEADDIQHAVPFSHPLEVSAGTYEDLAGCRVVIIAAGVNQQPGESRLQLLERNAAVFGDVVPSVLKHAPQAILLIATNPVDIMTHVAAHYAAQFDIPPSRVVGSGTTLDTARFRTLLGKYFGVDSRHVHGFVIGEHGDSEVLTWSLANIGGVRLADVEQFQHVHFPQEDRESIDRQVRHAAYQIISGKGATYYGIGAALARIVDAIIRDQRSIMTVSTHVDKFHGITDVTMALPCLVGGSGIRGIVPIQPSSAELQALRASAEVIQEAMASLKPAL